jgi:hypothetical protein
MGRNSLDELDVNGRTIGKNGHEKGSGRFVWLRLISSGGFLSTW